MISMKMNQNAELRKRLEKLVTLASVVECSKVHPFNDDLEFLDDDLTD